MENLDELRARIDEIDKQLKQLLLRRMDCSYEVAKAKAASGDITIYRADREAAILDNLGADVPQERKDEYLAVVRKIMESSRTYQYGLLFDWDNSLFDEVEGHEIADRPSRFVTVRLTRADRPNAMSAILSMVGDYGFQMEEMQLLGIDKDAACATFKLTIRGDVADDQLRKLLYQLSCESENFCIVDIR